jgi:alkaline phosphatase D
MHKKKGRRLSQANHFSIRHFFFTLLLGFVSKIYASSGGESVGDGLDINNKHKVPSSSSHGKSNTKPISRLAFASCYHQDKNTTIFKAIKRYEPDVFLWTGDSVYHTDGHNTTTLEKNYKSQFDRKDYKAFRESRPTPYIDGTWDDHDYGVNDAGKDLKEKNLRQNLFLNFLEIPLTSKRRTRKGMYSTFTYGPPEKKIRVILLDTRTFRDTHVIPSVGGIKLIHPIGAVIACMTRFFSSVFGFDADYNGDVSNANIILFLSFNNK